MTWARNTDGRLTRVDPFLHFWEKVNKNPGEGCWEWTADVSLENRPYGRFWNGSRGFPAWRWDHVTEDPDEVMRRSVGRRQQRQTR